MASRRVHVSRLRPGQFPLDPGQGHHVRDVLRLGVNDPLELFDDAGHVAPGRIVMLTPSEVVVEPMGEIADRAAAVMEWTVASAVPKGNRADWMVEKLAELGAAAFVPVQTARSVVHPEGKNKLERWRRIALEAAKQSRRVGTMSVEEVVPVATLVASLARRREHAWYLSTAAGARPIAEVLPRTDPRGPLTLLIGPEGGWTPGELGLFEANALTPVALTPTILRVETAALAAGAVVASWFNTSAVPAGSDEANEESDE